jgi:CRP-like cAMP-binding protein
MSRIVLLQKVPIFANLRPEDLRRVALVCKERLFPPGDIICYEGDPGDELYIVVSGQVQVLTGFGTNQPRALAISTEGEAVGMMAILDDIPRSATLRAHNGPVRLLILGADEFKRILRERPEMAAEVIRVLSRLLRETNKRIEQSPALTDNVPMPSH